MKALCPNDSFKPEYLGYVLRARAREVLSLVETALMEQGRLKSETFGSCKYSGMHHFLHKNNW